MDNKWVLIDFECVDINPYMDDIEVYTLQRGNEIKKVDDYTYHKMKQLGLIKPN